MGFLDAFAKGIAFPVSVDLSDMKTGLAQAQSELDKTQSNFTKTLSQNSKKIGMAATVAGGAIVGGLGLATKASVDFEKDMAEVFTLMPGMSKDAMDKMTSQVRDLSVEMGVLPEELVPALYQAISAGIPPENVFDFIKTANKAAVGGVTDLETAVDGITSVVNAYGSDILSATEASDQMFTAVKLGKTNFEELSNYIYQVIPTASSLGVEFGDVSAALATMTAQGTPTRVAATQLRAALVELSKDGGDTSDTFKRLAGKSFKEFIAEGHNLQDALNLMAEGTTKTIDTSDSMGKKIIDAKEKLAKYKDQLEVARLKQNEFTDSTKESSRIASEQKISNLTEDIAELEKFLSTAKVTTETTTVGINDLFTSVEAGNAVLALTGKGADSFTNALNEMDKSTGATNTAFETMDETAGRSMEKLMAAFEDLKLEIGDEILPILKEDILPILKNLVGIFKGIPDSLKPVILIIGALGAGLVVLGPLLIAMPGMITAIGIAFTILSAHPIILAVTAIIAGIVLLEMKFGILTKAAAALSAGLGWLTDNVISPLCSWLGQATEGVDFLGLAFKILLGPVGLVMIAMDALGISWGDVWEGMIGLAKTGVNWLIDGINLMVRALNILHFDVPEWVPLIGGQKIGFDLPELPRLAAGGIVTSPRMVMAGDGDEPEAIVPLSKAGSMGFGGVTISGNTFNVRNDQDIPRVARELYTLIERKNRGRGYPS